MGHAVMLLATALMTLAIAQDPPDDVYAVVVGHNGGGPQLPTLRYADDDALRLARWFEMLAGPDHVTVLAVPDDATRALLEQAHLPLPAVRPPTRKNLLQALASLEHHLTHRAAGRRAIVYVYYAGHGLGGHLLLQGEGAEPEGITGRELRLALTALSSNRVELFIDACRAQRLFAERGASGPDLSADIDALEQRASVHTLGVLTATQSDTPAGEASDLMGGFFSHVLASGLAGAADANGDAIVDFGELVAFVAFNTERITGQRPWFDPPGGDLRAPVVDLRGAPALSLPLDLEGRFRVTSIRGVPIFAEVNKARGQRMSLALPPGRYEVMQRLDDDRRRAGQVDVVEGASQGLPELGEPEAAAQRLERGGTDWPGLSFQAPFSGAVVGALEVGWNAGRPTTRSARRWSLDASYAMGPAPFALTGLEHGGELGARVHLASVVLGARVALRGSAHARGSTLWRAGFSLLGGWRFAVLDQALAFSPFVALGFRSVWVHGATGGDPFAPTLGGGVRIEGLLPGRRFSVWLDGRAEVTFVNVDGERSPFFDPMAVVGVSLWW